jgi:hypothetical protein
LTRKAILNPKGKLVHKENSELRIGFFRTTAFCKALKEALEALHKMLKPKVLWAMANAAP